VQIVDFAAGRDFGEGQEFNLHLNACPLVRKALETTVSIAGAISDWSSLLRQPPATVDLSTSGLATIREDQCRGISSPRSNPVVHGHRRVR
jgi:hypothetical protein